jgi:hypothetical protein
MKKRFLINKLITGILLFFSMASVWASAPLWTLTPLTQTSITVPVSGTATVTYQVTNQSRKTHTLTMTAIPGVEQVTTPGNCSSRFTLAYRQSCNLSLSITGSMLQGNVQGGPVVCEQSNRLQCYQPSQANSLNITVDNNNLVFTWEQTNGPFGGIMQSLSSPSGNSSVVFVGTFGGVFKTIDGGANWTAVNTGLSNLGVCQESCRV